MNDSIRKSGGGGPATRITDGKDLKPLVTARSARVRYHVTLLIAAILVIASSGLLQIKNTAEIEVPFWGTLPGICTWKNLTGTECPGCGVSRCFVEIGHGHWSNAWDYNPAGFLIFGLVLYQVPFRGLQLWRLRTGNSDAGHRILYVNLVAWGIVTALMAQWITKHFL